MTTDVSAETIPLQRLRVADIMNPKLLYIGADERLELTRSKMIAFGVTAVPVLDDCHRPVGVISTRDLLLPGDADATYPARVVRGDATIEEGARALGASGVHHLVVVDDVGVAIGMVSAIDFVRVYAGLPTQHPKAFEAF